MPDFDTRKPQGSNEPYRVRTTLIANRLRGLLRAGKLRFLSMASTLRSSLMANRLRTLLIGGILLIVIVAAPAGLLIYSLGGFSRPQQDARQVYPRCWGSLAQSTQNSKPGEDQNDTKLAFTRTIAGDALESELYVMNTDGSNETRLTNTSAVLATSPVWSPDGKKIAYLRGIDVASGRTDRDIYVINADGSGRTNLTNSKQSEDYFAWSPAGVGAITERTEEVNGNQREIDAAPQDETLQAYIEQINELLREKDLRGSEEGSDVRRLARAKTLRVLEGSDPTIKGKVVRFLAEADLVQDVGQRVPIVSLGNAELKEANLSGTDLRGADFRATDLGSSDLQKADLSDADLTGADLTGADLTDAELQHANLTNATLHATDLTRADLTGADLTGVHMTVDERREAEQSATGIYLPEEDEAKVRDWEAAARSSLKDLLASLETCLATTRVEEWDSNDSPEAIRDSNILRCTDSDSAFRYAQDDLRPNVAWRMIPQTEQVGIARENTGEVLIQVAHNEGGSAFQSSTGTNGRIERIPRWF